MENEDDLLNQMEDTRTSLTQKLETLESKVASTVEGTTTAVQETVAAVQETVQETVATIKHTVQDTVSSVKESVNSSVGAVQDFFDLGGHVKRHPWSMLLGSAAAGYCLGSLFQGPAASQSSAAQNLLGGSSRFSTRGQHHGNGGPKKERRESTGWLSSFATEFGMLKELALGVALGTAREMIVKGMSPALGQQLGQIIDNITQKIGGKPMEGSDWQLSQASQHGDVAEKPRSHEHQDTAAVSPTRREKDFGRF